MNGISYIGIIIVVAVIISVVLILNSIKNKKSKNNDIFGNESDNKENDIFLMIENNRT